MTAILSLLGSIGNFLLPLIKQFLLIGSVVVSLIFFGNWLDGIIPWSIITSLFAFIKQAILLMDFMVDTDVLFSMVGWSFYVLFLYWSVKAVVYVAGFFNQK